MNTDANCLPPPASAREGSPMLDSAGMPEPPSRAATVPDAKPSGPRLGRLVIVAALIFAVLFAAGWIPRLRARNAVRADTRELAVPTVSLIAPVPAKAAPPLMLSG